MVQVTVDRVRSKLNLTADDIPDSTVEAHIGDAAAWLTGEIGSTLNPEDCTEEERLAIEQLAAVYCYLTVTGTEATGYSVALTGLSFSGPAEKVAQIEFLRDQVLSFVKRRKHSDSGILSLEGK
ncbi:hypothetical protein GWN63_02260 [Candidatus Bathyarchaeota archaeon]|nr:hypothetical protein [Candidatus Bathyarchaeota archaeon]NIR12701.1 hypothetical protein [Desulfobacterales bacterium]NIU81056.1 hypothetical protein [Candidatus Bathyarchaeota archaeon]NIV67710.1 hypothetical protein [Candidatus Bathyarchaeota archaeon]NIW34319.1 hypothetical protein [Candidatus Bathyarchaeota archaeon]